MPLPDNLPDPTRSPLASLFRRRPAPMQVPPLAIGPVPQQPIMQQLAQIAPAPIQPVAPPVPRQRDNAPLSEDDGRVFPPPNMAPASPMGNLTPIQQAASQFAQFAAPQPSLMPLDIWNGGQRSRYVGGQMIEQEGEDPATQQLRLRMNQAMNDEQTRLYMMMNGQQMPQGVNFNPLGSLAREGIEDISQQQNRQGLLGIERAREFGVNGTPGNIANRASDSQNRTRENDRYGPSARYDEFFMNAFNAFPQGTPAGERLRSLNQQGFSSPAFMTGGTRPTGEPNPTPTSRFNPGAITGPQGVVERAFESAYSDVPMQNGVRSVSAQWAQQNPAIAQRVLTNLFASITDDAALQQHFPDIQRRLVADLGNSALNDWINSPNVLTSTGLEGQRQQAQIQRLLRMAGMRQTPIGPTSAGLSWWQRPGAILSAPFSHWEQQ